MEDREISSTAALAPTKPQQDAPPSRSFAGVASTAIGVCATLVLGLSALVPALRVLKDGETLLLRLSWDAAHGPFCIGLDPLSAFFLLPIACLSILAAVYGSSYLFAYRERKSLASSWLFFNLFVAGMIFVVLARTVFLFLVAWEVMSLSAYFLVTFEHEKADVRRAGWIYLIATHLGVAFLLAAFLLLGRLAGSLEFEMFRKLTSLDAGWAGLIFALSVVGFGAKAGLVPFHIWLPEAHPAAPSHVSALMSGVMIKMGLYGLLRVLTFLGAPALWWGFALAAIGLSTALAGMALALHQRDIKRVLAYSSIENMGLITLALGVSLWGLASELPTVAVLGLLAALLHIWNHAAMKGLMFLGAGSVLHGTGTKDMEQLGGLMKRMPWTGGVLFVGALAIAALPPMNGFASKWLVYMTLLKGALAAGSGQSLLALFTVGLLALLGGLAAIAFVRLIGVVLLGSPRSEEAQHAHESSPWMLGPMVLLVVLCAIAAVIPQLLAEGCQAVLNQFLGQQAGPLLLDLEAADVPLYLIGNLNAWTLLVCGATAGGLVLLTRGSKQAKEPTWGCGYVQPTARMQYTGRSLAELMAEHLLPRFVRPKTTREAPQGLFPAPGHFRAESPDPLSERVYEPFFVHWAERFSRLRVLQQGKVHVYLLYIALTVVLALAWVTARAWWATL